MFKLLKGGYCYAPNDMGIKDILVVCDKIYRIGDNIRVDIMPDIEVIDCSGCIVCPAFIDQHVHITGGGGEEGPASRIPEIELSDLITAGVATLVGVLGADGITRSAEALLAKARALEAEGLSTYIYTGSYSVPTTTITGRVLSDMVLIDKVIGVGEIAISDHRSSNPTLEQLAELASQVHLGGLLGHKAGIMHIHVGDGKDGLSKLFSLIEAYDLPIGMFVPTHLNRNSTLLGQAVEYASIGGNTDLTAGEKSGRGVSIPEALAFMLEKGTDMNRVTVSSDGNGSIPADNGNNTGVGLVKQLYEDIKASILYNKVSPQTAFKTVTENVARVLGLYPKKGTIAAGSDADLLVLDKNSLSINIFLVKGKKYMNNGKPLKKGRYEK